MKFYPVLIIAFLGIGNILFGQIPRGEIGSFEYSVIPEVGDTQIETYKTNLNFGTKIGNSMLLFGLSYSFYDFFYKKDSLIDFDLSPYEKIHIVQLRFLYRYKISDSWFGNIMFSPSLSSNFKGTISKNDLIINTIATVSKKWGDDVNFSILTFGAGFGTPFGEPQVFPAISFRKKINKNWIYSLGIPETAVNYIHKERHTFSAKANFNGVFANSSSPTTLPDTSMQTNTKLQYNSLNTGFQYNYRIQPNWTTTINIGYSPWNRLRVLDSNNDELFDIGASSSFYISMGLKFNLNKMMNENKN